MIPLLPILLYGGLALGIVAGLAARRRARGPIRRLLQHAERLPVTPLDQVRDGQWVKLVGIVSLEEAMLAPLTGRRCACYRVEASIDTDFGARVEDQGQRDFTLRDEADRVRVCAAAGMVLAGAADSVDADRVRSFFARRGRELLADTPLSGSETVVEEGARIAVVGVAIWVPEPAGYREVGRRLELRGDSRRPLVVLHPD